MESLEQERKRKLEEEVEAKKRQAKEKQEHHEAKIKESKQRSEMTALEKKKLYDEKERAAEEKKRKYEEKKEEMKRVNEAKFQKKEELIERAKSANANTLAKRKEEYYEQLRKNEERRKEKEREQQQLLEAHLREEKEKERKREEAKKSNMNQLEERKVTLIKSAEDKEHKIKSVAERKDAERMLKNNLDHMKKMDKLENVRRKERQKEWERNNLWNKILDENEKIEGMKKEKKNLLQEKAEVKAKIDRDKEELAKKFQLVKEGKLDPKNLFQGQGETGGQEGSVRSNRGGSVQAGVRKDRGLAGSASQTAQHTKVGFTTEAAEGVNSAPTGAGKSDAKLPPAARKTTQNRVRGASPGKERPKFEAKVGEALETATLRLKDVQGREMLKVLEEENKAEHTRESELLLVSDLQERKRLQKIHAVQKAKAKERISRMMARHEEEMDELKAKLK